jgi:hypothetical protein
VTTGIEAYAGRAAGKAASCFYTNAKQRHEINAAVESARALIPTALADAAFEELAPDELLGVAAYLESPDFEYLAFQMVIAHFVKSDDMRSWVREQLREGLRPFLTFQPNALDSSPAGRGVKST